MRSPVERERHPARVERQPDDRIDRALARRQRSVDAHPSRCHLGFASSIAVLVFLVFFRRPWSRPSSSSRLRSSPPLPPRRRAFFALRRRLLSSSSSFLPFFATASPLLRDLLAFLAHGSASSSSAFLPFLPLRPLPPPLPRRLPSWPASSWPASPLPLPRPSWRSPSSRPGFFLFLFLFVFLLAGFFLAGFSSSSSSSPPPSRFDVELVDRIDQLVLDVARCRAVEPRALGLGLDAGLPTISPVVPARSLSRMMYSSRRFSTLPVMTPSTLSFFATFLMFLSVTFVASSSSAVSFHLSIGDDRVALLDQLDDVGVELLGLRALELEHDDALAPGVRASATPSRTQRGHDEPGYFSKLFDLELVIASAPGLESAARPRPPCCVPPPDTPRNSSAKSDGLRRVLDRLLVGDEALLDQRRRGSDRT